MKEGLMDIREIEQNLETPQLVTLDLSTRKGEIISLFWELCKPQRDGKVSPKGEAIIDFFKKHDVEAKYIQGQGIVVNEQKSPKVIIMNHYDLIKPFNNAFEDGEQRSSLSISKNGHEILSGPLDNTICNAVAIYTYLDLLKNNQHKDVMLLFTEGEEVGCKGASKFIRENKEDLKQTFFINLDVTNEAYGKYGSVEYDYPNKQMEEQVVSLLGEKFPITHYRVCDDTDAVNSAELSGYSFCIPTKGVIHSFKNRVKTSSIEPYQKALCDLVTKIDYTKDFGVERPKYEYYHFSQGKGYDDCDEKDFDEEDYADNYEMFHNEMFRMLTHVFGSTKAAKMIDDDSVLELVSYMFDRVYFRQVVFLLDVENYLDQIPAKILKGEKRTKKEIINDMIDYFENRDLLESIDSEQITFIDIRF